MSVGYHGIDLPALSTVASSQSKSVCVEDAEQSDDRLGDRAKPHRSQRCRQALGWSIRQGTIAYEFYVFRIETANGRS